MKTKSDRVQANHNKVIKDAAEGIAKKGPSKAHFAGKYKLKPSTTYNVNGYTYKTDHLGRIKSVEGKLKLQSGTRNTTHQKKAGGTDRLKTDDGGHLIGTRFDGSGKIDNIVPMNSNLNRGAFKKLENIWEKALKNGQNVDVKITPKYTGNSARPDSFNIKQTIDGVKKRTYTLKNIPGG